MGGAFSLSRDQMLGTRMLTMTRLHPSCLPDRHAVFWTQQSWISSSHWPLSPADARRCVCSPREEPWQIRPEETTTQWLGGMCVWRVRWENISGSWKTSQGFSTNKITMCWSTSATSGPDSFGVFPTWLNIPRGRICLGTVFWKEKCQLWACGSRTWSFMKNNNQENLISQKKRSFHDKVPESKHFPVKQNKLQWIHLCALLHNLLVLLLITFLFHAAAFIDLDCNGSLLLFACF